MDSLPSTKNHLPGLRSLANLFSSFNNRYGIRGLYIGWKKRDDEFTGRNAVVIVVDKKISKKELSKGECIPRRINYDEPNSSINSRTIQTDIVQKYGSIKEQIFFNPGDKVQGKSSAGAPIHATVGAFGLHLDFGPVFVTAGHFTSQIDRRRNIVLIDRSSNPARELSGKLVKSERANLHSAC